MDITFSFFRPRAEERITGKDSSTTFRIVRGDEGKIKTPRFSMLNTRNIRFTKIEQEPGSPRLYWSAVRLRDAFHSDRKGEDFQKPNGS